MIRKIFNQNYFLLFLIIPLSVIPFLQSGLLLDLSLNIRFLALNIWLIMLLGFLIFNRKKISIDFNKFLALYLFYILYSVISFYLSNNYADAAFQFIMITNLGLLIFFYAILFNTFSFKFQDIALIFNVLALVILSLIIIDCFKILSICSLSHQSIYKIKATFSHKNILSEVLFILFPFALYLLIHGNKWLRILGLINSVGILFFIIILLTRAVWISLILGYFITTLLFIIISGKENIISLFKNRKFYLFIISFIIVIASSLFVYSRLDSFETINKSVRKIFKVYDSSQHRVELWKRSIEITKESPLIGKGLGMWRIEVLKYGNRNLKSEDNITFYQRPHNDFLWILSEQGIIGLLFYLSLLVLICFYLIKIIKSVSSNKERNFYYLMFYLLTGYTIFSFFSFPRERIEHNLFLGIILGFIITNYQKIKIKSTTKLLNNNYLNIVFVIILIFLIFGIKVAYTRFNAETHLKKAFEARNAADWDKVINECNLSESDFYQIDMLSTPISWYRGEAYFKKADIEMAFINYQQSLILNPYHIHVLNNLATTYEIKSEHEKAIELYKKAISISPNFEDALLNLTAVYFNMGNIDSATNYIYLVDTLTKNVKYLPFLEAILKKRLDDKIKTIDNKLILDVLTKIIANNEWMRNIFIKSKRNSITFDKQLFIDCLFVLKEIDKSIDEKQYVELKRKYLNS
ncbi:MAG: O-antigen ligase family protein [Bacteroidetes bacterium]|nr:O-antigen ligase family protein [Bacteroidota bacterium]